MFAFCTKDFEFISLFSSLLPSLYSAKVAERKELSISMINNKTNEGERRE